MEHIKLMKWLKRNCLTKMVKLNDIYDYYWCFIEDANNCWDGIDDDRLKWYTDEEIFNLYKNNNNL